MIAKAHEAGLGVIVVHGEQPEMGRQAGDRFRASSLVSPPPSLSERGGGDDDRPINQSGAGSFGHPQAKKYQVNGGWSHHRAAQDPEAFQHVRYGFAATR